MVAPKRVSFSGLVPRTLRRSSREVGAASVMLRSTVSEKMKKVGRPACLASSRRQSLRRASSSSWAEVSSGAGGGGAGRLLGWTAEVPEGFAAGLGARGCKGSEGVSDVEGVGGLRLRCASLRMTGVGVGGDGRGGRAGRAMPILATMKPSRRWVTRLLGTCRMGG